MLIECKTCEGAGGWCGICNSTDCKAHEEAAWVICGSCDGKCEVEDPAYDRAEAYEDAAVDYFYEQHEDERYEEGRE